MKFKKGEKKVKEVAVLQIIILILGIIAIGYAIGGSIKEVSAETIEYTDPVSGEVEYSTNRGTPDLNTTDPRGAGGNFDPLGGVLTKIFSTIGGLLGLPIKGGSIAAKAIKGAVAGSTKSVITGGLTSIAIYFGLKTILPHIFTGLQSGETNAIAAGAAAGFAAAKVAAMAIGKSGVTIFGLGPTGIGVVVGLAIFVATYKKSKVKTYTFKCDTWMPPAGGQECDKCNDQGIIPCTEYQCRSLGEACEIVNKGSTEEKCAWKTRNDLAPPILQPWEEILPDGFSYAPDQTISPPDRGVKVLYNGGCVPAFKRFEFGVTSNELVRCKIDNVRKSTFDEMLDYMAGSNTLKKNHSQSMMFLSEEALEAENITIEDNNLQVYVRCVDVNQNPKPDSPSASFVFKYCVEPGPDTSPPEILGTNLPNNTPIAYNQTTVNLVLYVNEYAECKWTRERDMTFDQMGGTMSCPNSSLEINSQMAYSCTTTINSIVSKEENSFFFRCKDKPWLKGTNKEGDRIESERGYHFTLLGTEPLVIEEYGPEGIVKGATDTAKITLTAKTAAGHHEGDATCFYSQSCYEKLGSKTAMTMFYYGDAISSYEHSQDIWVTQGTYNCVIQCIDLGGNMDKKEFTYTVEIDQTHPNVIRVYEEAGNLKIITNEEATCVYSNDDCNFLFNDGLTMNTIDGLGHFTSWNTDKTYYIRCQDNYGIDVGYGNCDIVVKPFSVISSN